jgi:predicted transcriptional regulator
MSDKLIQMIVPFPEKTPKPGPLFLDQVALRTLLVLDEEIEEDEIYGSHLSRIMGTNWNTLKDRLKEMEDKGLVKIVPLGDRASKVSITKKGERIASMLRELRDAIDAQ